MKGNICAAMMIYQRGEAREAEFLVTYCILVTASSTMLCSEIFFRTLDSPCTAFIG